MRAYIVYLINQSTFLNTLQTEQSYLYQCTCMGAVII